MISCSIKESNVNAAPVNPVSLLQANTNSLPFLLFPPHLPSRSQRKSPPAFDGPSHADRQKSKLAFADPPGPKPQTLTHPPPRSHYASKAVSCFAARPRTNWATHKAHPHEPQQSREPPLQTRLLRVTRNNPPKLRPAASQGRVCALWSCRSRYT